MMGGVFSAGDSDSLAYAQNISSSENETRYTSELQSAPNDSQLYNVELVDKEEDGGNQEIDFDKLLGDAVMS